MSADISTTIIADTCADGCTMHHVLHKTCQCYYGCLEFHDCCLDFMKHCEGMAGIEYFEKLALAQVAAFSVFYSIIMFVLLFVILLWGFYTLWSYCKKHGGRSSFESSGFILKDSRIMIILSYLGMTCFVLSIFCYLISNASLGIEYNSHNDVYGNSQITAIIFWFFGHTIFYQLFMLKLYNFMAKTTYNLSKTLQITSLTFLLALWFTSFIVMIVWIDEFHNNYHYGSINDSKIIACMVIAFAAHVWFCLSLVLFFSIVLYQVVQNRGTTLIQMSSSDTNISKSELEEKVIEYMTRITVLCLTALFVTVFCMLCWIILIGLDYAAFDFVRFCWWLFPINVLFSFLSLFLGLNFHPNMNSIYKKVCVCPHALCKFYCVRATLPSKSSKHQRGTKIRDYEDDDDDDDDDEDEELNINDNTIIGARRDDDNNNNDDDVEEEEEEQDQDEDDDDDDSQERHGFNPMNTDQTRLNAGE